MLCSALLAIELVFLLRNLQPTARLQARDGEFVATYEKGRNEVRQKPDGTIIWGQPQPGQTLFSGDSIATMEESDALVKFTDLSEIQVEPDSLIVLEQAPKAQGLLPGAGPDRVIARLLKGSLKRTSKMPSKLVLKLSRDADAPEMKLDDEKGGAVFRVVHKKGGAKVVVESGAVKLIQGKEDAGRTIQSNEKVTIKENGAVEVAPVSAPDPKLPPPKMKKPKVRIRKTTDKPLLESLWDALVPQAFADEVPDMVSIDLSWDPVEEARAYRVQLSSDPKFKKVMKEATVKKTAFAHKTAATLEDTNLYFRVAAIDSEGNVGEFSDPETVKIEGVASVETTTPEMTFNPPLPATPPVADAPTPSLPLAPPAPEPAPVALAETVATPAVIAPEIPLAPMNFRFETAYGAVYSSRDLKSDVPPQETSGSGLVPARFRGEFTLFAPKRFVDQVRVGVASTFEKAEATLMNGTSVSLSLPSHRGNAVVSRSFGNVCFGTGVFVATTSQITWSQFTLSAQKKTLAGWITELGPLEPMDARFHWRLQLTGLLVGTTGFEGALWARKPFFASRTYGGKQRFAFAAIEYRLRSSKIENSHGSTVELGYAF